MPFSSSNPELSAIFKQKRHILVLNKADLVPNKLHKVRRTTALGQQLAASYGLVRIKVQGCCSSCTAGTCAGMLAVDGARHVQLSVLLQRGLQHAVLACICKTRLFCTWAVCRAEADVRLAK